MDKFMADRMGVADVGVGTGVAAVLVGGLGLLLLFQIVVEVTQTIRYWHIPGPGGRLPVLGHALDLMKGNMWETLGKWGDQYGSIYKIFILGKVVVIVTDTAHIKQMMQTNAKNYEKDQFCYSAFDCLLGNGIVLSEGERWHQLRRQLAPTFKLEILGDVGAAAMLVTRKIFAELDAVAAKEEPVDMAEVFRKATLQVIGSAVLSLTPEECDANLADLYLPIIEECNDRSWFPLRQYTPTPAWFRHRNGVRRLNTYIGDKVSARLQRKFAADKAGEKFATNDILDRIVAGIDERECTEQSRIELRDGLKTFLFAGHDTTSCMLTWTLYYILAKPDLQQTVFDEAKSVFPHSDSVPRFEQLASALPHTFNMLREALRIRPPVPIVARRFKGPDTMGGKVIPGGTTSLILLEAAHKNPALWPQGDVEEFRPSRFGEAATTSPQTGLGEGIDSWSFLPFINGPRNCLGQHFSLLESRVILGLLCQRYTFAATPGLSGASHKFRLPVAPIDGLKVFVHRRET